MAKLLGLNKPGRRPQSIQEAESKQRRTDKSLEIIAGCAQQLLDDRQIEDMLLRRRVSMLGEQARALVPLVRADLGRNNGR